MIFNDIVYDVITPFTEELRAVFILVTISIHAVLFR